MTSKYAFRYTDEHIAFLTKGYMEMGVIKLADKFNKAFGLDKKPSQIKSILKNYKIKCGRGTGELMKGVPKSVTPEQLEWVKLNCPNLSRIQLTEQFNKLFNESKTKAQLVALVKNHKFKSGRTGHFEKGVPSWSKGTKGVLKANSGSFKKGQTPHNWVPVGSKRVNSYGYHDTKVAEPNVWVGDHILLWEKHNGPIPINHNVRFIDNDRNNVTINNLILVNKSEHQYLTLNNFSDQPEELKDTVLLVSRIQAKTNQLVGAKHD